MRISALGLPEVVILLVVLLLMLLPLLLLWRVFEKAGLPPVGALLCLLPGVGFVLALAVLAFAQWPGRHAESIRSG